MHIIFVSILFAGISYKLFQKAAGSMAISRLNIISIIFYLYLIGMSYIGLTLAKVGVENYALRKAGLESLDKAYWATTYVLLMMPLSMIFYQKYFFGGNIKIKLENFYTKKLIPLQSNLDSAQLFFWACVTIIVTLAGLYSFSVLSKVPILAILKNASSGEIGELRFIAKFDFPGNRYIRNLLFQNLAPLISFIAYGYKKLYSNNIKIRIWFYYSLFIAFLAMTFTGEKAPIIIYFITLFIIKGIIEGGYTKKLLVISLLFGFSLIILLYTLIDKNVSFGIYGGIFSRLLMVPSAGLLQTFEIFPKIHDFLNGASFPGWMVSNFGLEHERSARVIMEILNPNGILQGTAGVMSSLYVAEAYANFGLAGLIIAPFIGGFVVQYIYNIILNAPKSPLYVALMAYFLFEFPILGGIVGFIWNVGWFLLAIIVFLSLRSRIFFLTLKK